ncbi:glycosyltransferase family 2 protein [Sulfurospirillum deleyianum]|uniref:Glycosyl transferase family 2 n=1 Tax=Sulfurospirillum deleyianum (strain ATCC 51133 / DSM 6946 / 5175) TaxID=525898 RepID=D1B2F3_SULD5|nr:glycosyltransferase family A protein [Sulfurospirillum deleyianum]ACZ12273.1 glycosyl transferase family 2 [Sulfurospirillum deleyianum DSM 6946]
MKENKMIHQHLSIVVPFYNPPYEAFKTCLENIRVLDPLEVILVDDCSTDTAIIALAKQSGFTYLKTPYQSGHDGLPFNIGLQHVKGTYVCKVDADDLLLELPATMPYNIHLARINRSVDPTNLTLEELILAPRSIHNGAIITTDIARDVTFSNDHAIFNDVLTLLRLLYRKERFSVHPTMNYIYNDIPNSIQTSKPRHYHRLRHIQTVARFCQLEAVSHEQSEYFLKLAMLNFRYGAKARNMLKTHISSKELA